MVTAMHPPLEQSPPQDSWTTVASKRKKPPPNATALDAAPEVAGIPVTTGSFGPLSIDDEALSGGDGGPMGVPTQGANGVMELPEDLIRAIMGFLDVRGLLTARLVCKQFLQSASAHLKGLHISIKELEEAPTSNLLQLSGLTRLAVSVPEPDDLHLLAQPRIAPFVTHVSLSLFDMLGPSRSARDKREMLVSLMCLPKLRSLSLYANLDAVPYLPLSLEELDLGRYKFVWGDASPLTRLSRLTKLSFGVEDEAALVSLAGLQSLCSLELWCDVTPSGVLNTLTMLTSLKLRRGYFPRGETGFPALAHLTGLLDLTLSGAFDVTSEEFACLSHLTKLTRLDLDACNFTESVRGSSALAPLTGLVRLGLDGGAVGASLLPHVNREALKSLDLKSVAVGDLSALRRASGLTALAFESSSSRGGDVRELGPTLSKMSGLCSLDLDLGYWRPSRRVFRLCRILQALTCLTYLHYRGSFSVRYDLQACASLPRLRSLKLSGTRELTTACLADLQAMSGLSKLALWCTGIRQEDLKPKVRKAFDVKRLRRGWPCLELQVD